MRLKRSLAVMLAVPVLLDVAASAAYATTYQSSIYNFSVNGRAYDSWSYINNDSAIYAGAEVWTVSGQNVGGGNWGVQPRLYASNGTLCNTTPVWFIPAVPKNDFWAYQTSSPGSCLGTSVFYSQGLAEVSRTGDGNNMSVYTDYPTNPQSGHAAAVRATPAAESNGPASFPHNAAGMSYGSALRANSVGKDPDLILAAGANDVLGYVRSSDLNAGSGAGLTTSGPPTAHSIPLYAVDGTTVIGKYDMTLPAHN